MRVHYALIRYQGLLSFSCTACDCLLPLLSIPQLDRAIDIVQIETPIGSVLRMRDIKTMVLLHQCPSELCPFCGGRAGALEGTRVSGRDGSRGPTRVCAACFRGLPGSVAYRGKPLGRQRHRRRRP